MTTQILLLAWGVGFGALSSIPTGPVVVLILRNSLLAGPVAGLVSLASLLVVEMVYLVLFWLGLGEPILTTDWIRRPVFLAGGVVLLVLGVRSWRSPQGSDDGAGATRSAPLGAMFREALLVAATNPAILLIFASLLATARSAFGPEAVREGQLPLLLAMEVGAAAWFAFLIAAVSRLPAGAAAALRRRAARGAGAILVVFGAWMLADTLREIVA